MQVSLTQRPFAGHMVRKKRAGNSEDTTVDNSTPDTTTDVAGRKYPVLAAKIDGSYLDYIKMLPKKVNRKLKGTGPKNYNENNLC